MLENDAPAIYYTKWNLEIPWEMNQCEGVAGGCIPFYLKIGWEPIGPKGKNIMTI